MKNYQQSLELALAAVKAGDIIPVPLFPIGKWTSAKYPSLPLTRELADELIANFEAKVLGTEPMADTSGRHDQTAPAGGWFKRLHVEPTKDGGELLVGDMQVNELGAQKLNDEEYRYSSVDIGPVVDNTTGAKTPNVFKGTTFCNTPVLRIMPAILETGDALAASEVVEIACSEITAAEKQCLSCGTVNPDDADVCLSCGKKLGVALAEEFVDELFLAVWPTAMVNSLPDSAFAYIEPGGSKDSDGKTTPRSLRHFPIRDASGKADPAHVRNALSRLPQSTLPADAKAKAKAAIDRAAASLGIGDSLKGAEDMKTIALKLNLAEDASEDLVLAEVVKITDERDALKVKLAERDAAERKSSIEARLSAAVEAREIKPAERDGLLKLADEKPEAFDAFMEARKGLEVIAAGEVGDAGTAGETSEDPTVQLAEAAEKIAKDRGIGYGEAMVIAAQENAKLADSYLEV